MARRRLTEAEREERRRRDRESLEQATRDLLTSEGWQRWIELRRRNGLARYSLRNQLLIATEMHRRGVAPRYVAGFRWWAEHGYQVRRGEKAVRILAPVRRRVADQERDEDGPAVVGFRGASVFDLSQVDAGAEAVALEPPPAEPVSGESHARHLGSVEELLAGLGCTVSYAEIERSGTEGFYRPKSGEVVIESRRPANARLRTLLHEAGHALVDRELSLPDEGKLSYAEEEVAVETIGYLAASAIGLDTRAESVSYCALWSERGDAERVRRVAELIDAAARRLEQAMDRAEVGEESRNMQAAA